MRRPNPARAPRRRAPALVASVAIAAATLVGVPRAVEAAPAPDATTSFTWLAELSDLSLGNSHACGIDDNDEAYCWGNDTQLQLGDGLPQQRMTTPSPVAVAGTVLDGKKIVDIASGGRHSCALTDDDLIGCWGDNSMAQLGNGTYVGSAVPVAVTIAGGPLDGKDLTAITAGENQSCALTADGIAACWGANFNGQLGDGTTSFRTTPRAVVTTGTPLDGVPIDQIEATGQNTCALAATGEFGCTGIGADGNLGRGSTANATKLVAPTTAGTVLDGKDIYAFGVGGAGACVATTDGELACWGADNRGQVGDGTPGDDELTPKAVTTTGTVLDDETVVEIAAGRDHTCVRTKEEILACWGAGSLGALGNGDAADSATPVAVKTEGTILEGLAVVGVASGDGFSCATNQGDQPACWGAGDGRLGQGSIASSSTPVAVLLRADEPGVPAPPTAVPVDEGVMDLTWSPPADDGDAPITSYEIRVYEDGNPTPIDTATGYAGHATISLDSGTTYRFSVAAVNAVGVGGHSALSAAVELPAAATFDDAAYVPVTPCRLVDTRLTGGRFADREIRQYYVSGLNPAFQGGSTTDCGVPSQAVAIEASITAVDPLDSGFFRAWPTGEPVPNATFMNFDRGMDITNTGTIALSDGGGQRFRARNYGGASHYVIDVQGYFLPSQAPEAPAGATTSILDPTGLSVYLPITPCRILDTRQVGGTLADREIRDISVADDARVTSQGGKAGGCGVPEEAVAVEAAVAAVDPAGSGFFRAWPAGQSVPNATFMNFDRGMDITNTGSIAIAPLAGGAGGATTDAAGDQLRIRNYGGASHYVIDVQGFWLPLEGLELGHAMDAATYAPQVPCRIVDTRQAGGALADREIRDVVVVGDGPAFAAQGGTADGCDIPAQAVAVEASITAVDPADSGFFRAWPGGQSVPNATFMNFDEGMDITNTGSVTIAADELAHLRIRNYGGASHYVIDIQGSYGPSGIPL